MNLRRLAASVLSRVALETKRRVYRLEVDAKELELLTVKDFVQRVCDSSGCSPKESANIKLAVDEACTNIIRHAYEGKAGEKITLEIGVGFLDMKIKIMDRGKSFDFQGIKDPDLNRYVDIGKKGGLGIWLIKKVMNRVTYHPYADHNELVLYRRLAQAPPKEFGLRKGAFSVSTKFTFGAVALVSVCVLMAYVFLTGNKKALVAKQQSERVNSIVRTLSAGSGEGIVRRDDLELGRLVREAQSGDKDRILAYAFVVGQEGRYLAHSDLGELLKAYDPPPGARAPHDPGIRTFKLKWEGESVTDYVSPVFLNAQWVGEVHVGVSDAALQGLLARVKFDYGPVFLAIFVVGILGLYVLSRMIIRPFRKILEGVRAMSLGDLNAKISLDSQDEFGALANIFNDMTSRIQDSQKGLMERERLEKEMQVAQEIQHTLLPTEFPRVDGYEIGAIYRAAKEVGGDYYDFFWVDPTTLGIVVADVSGKGVPGSMVMTMIRTAMRLEARGNKSASDVLSKINSHVTSDMKKGMFVTMFYIVLDSRNRTINFSSAGHNPMVLYRGETKEVYFLKPRGFPVGIDLPEVDMFEKNLALQKVSLHKDDMLVIYTDGITEAMNAQNEQFGEERLIQVIKENYALTPSEFVNKLDAVVSQFTGGVEQHDDITVVAIKEKMTADRAAAKFRKRLIDLVEKKGLSVAEACRRMNISPKTYYHYKKTFNAKGRKGLRPARAKDRALVQELTLEQKEAVMALVKEHPEYGARRIAANLAGRKGQPFTVSTAAILRFLKRRGLKTLGDRKAFSLNP